MAKSASKAKKASARRGKAKKKPTVRPANPGGSAYQLPKPYRPKPANPGRSAFQLPPKTIMD